MAHQVETMAYRNTAKPWHGLGSPLPAGQSIEQWQIAAGMDWEILESPSMYAVGTASGITFKTNPESKVLFRSDSQAALSVVSTRYKPVQPREILEFYRSLVTAGGFEVVASGRPYILPNGAGATRQRLSECFRRPVGDIPRNIVRLWGDPHCWILSRPATSPRPTGSIT